jgi:uncharacterized protein YcaQ
VKTVTLEQLTRLYLDKQFLLPKTKKENVVAVAGALCGLQSQMPLTPYFSLWNRIKGFKPEMLDTALYDDRSLVKTWSVRGTVHIFPSKDLPIYHNALKRMWFEHHGRYMGSPEWPSLEERRELIYPNILKALAKKPLKRKELDARVRKMMGNAPKSYERLFSAWGGILKETSYMGLTVFAEPSGREACFARLDQWLPEIGLDKIGESQARDKLLLKYLQGFGPASHQDFACWSGLLAGEARQSIESVHSQLEEVHLEGSGKRLWMLKSNPKEIEEMDLEEKVPPRLLPKFDPYLLGHKERTRAIEEGFLKKVCRPAGDIAAVLLVNGRVHGTWNYRKTKKRLTVAITPFRKLDEETIAQLELSITNLTAVFKVHEARMVLNQ